MNDFSRFNSRLKEPRLPRSSLVAWSLFALLVVFITWASLFQLDEVTTGSGKVIPSSHEQVIQSLEGGDYSQSDGARRRHRRAWSTACPTGPDENRVQRAGERVSIKRCDGDGRASEC